MKRMRSAPFCLPADPRHWLAALLAASLASAPAWANDDADNPNRPQSLTPAERAEPIIEKPAQEVAVTLPAFPRARDLIPLRAGRGGAEYSYYVDVNSVSLSADEVLLYTIVIQSPDGASNILYEGIRCATDEVKSFAYGTRDGRFERMADPEWTYYYHEGALGYRRDLMETYVCSETGWAVDADTVLERLVMHDPRRARVSPREFDAGD